MLHFLPLIEPLTSQTISSRPIRNNLKTNSPPPEYHDSTDTAHIMHTPCDSSIIFQVHAWSICDCSRLVFVGTHLFAVLGGDKAGKWSFLKREQDPVRPISPIGPHSRHKPPQAILQLMKTYERIKAKIYRNLFSRENKLGLGTQITYFGTTVLILRKKYIYIQIMNSIGLRGG